jgi:hypothetical protein
MFGLVAHAFRVARYSARRLLERRSKAWPAAERRFLARFPSCEACGGQDKLQVHHRKPVHIDLCMAPDRDCHFLVGHGGSFRAYNPEVEQDAAAMRRSYLMADPEAKWRVVHHASSARLFE